MEPFPDLESKGMELELGLLLRTGRSKEVSAWTSPEQKTVLGPTGYHGMRLQALAAVGDYTLAQLECSHLVDSLTEKEPGQEPSPPRELMALSLGQAILDGQTGMGSVPSLLQRAITLAEFYSRTRGLAQNLRQEADLTVFRGLLALEEGKVGEARSALREALDLWKDDQAVASGGGIDFNTRTIAQDCLALLGS